MGVKAYYQAAIPVFRADDDDRILGVLTTQHHHALEGRQRYAWLEQLKTLKPALAPFDGRLLLECYIPRMGKRADAVLLTGGIVFVLEFKVGAREPTRDAVLQVEDYALDLKNFHEGSHDLPIVPVLICTAAASFLGAPLTFAENQVAQPLITNAVDLGTLIRAVVEAHPFPALDEPKWLEAGYRPTPTIVEAAQALYQTHNVIEIARSDAGAKNLQETSATVSGAIDAAGAVSLMRTAL